jgi:hypothetical protein
MEPRFQNALSLFGDLLKLIDSNENSCFLGMTRASALLAIILPLVAKSSSLMLSGTCSSKLLYLWNCLPGHPFSRGSLSLAHKNVHEGWLKMK